MPQSPPYRDCIAFLVLLLAPCTALAVGVRQPPEPIGLKPGSSHEEGFDSLAGVGRHHPFPPPDGQSCLSRGWWASRSTYDASDGGVNSAGGLFSYGAPGSHERALGALTSNQVRHVAWGVSLQLDPSVQGSKDALWALEISYTGEQWSVGSNSSSILIFDYSIVSAEDYSGDQKWGYYDTTPGLWMVKDALSFSGPIVGGEEQSLDGNSAPNRQTLNHTLAIDDWYDNRIVQLRWTRRDSSGKDHGLAIDDLTVSLRALRDNEPPAPSHSSHKHSSPWFYAGICIAGVTIALIVMGIMVTLIIKRRQNARESQEAYSLLSSDGDSGEELPNFASDSTSINPASGIGVGVFRAYVAVAGGPTTGVARLTFGDEGEDTATTENEAQPTLQTASHDEACPECGKQI